MTPERKNASYNSKKNIISKTNIVRYNSVTLTKVWTQKTMTMTLWDGEAS